MKIIDKLAWIRVEDRKVLCVRSRGKELFYTPGGKREPGETDQEALVREIREELSVELIPGTLELFGTFEAPADGKGPDTLVRLTCYSGDYLGTLRPASEIAEAAWLGRADAPKCSAALLLVLEDLGNRGLI